MSSCLSRWSPVLAALVDALAFILRGKLDLFSNISPALFMDVLISLSQDFLCESSLLELFVAISLLIWLEYSTCTTLVIVVRYCDCIPIYYTSWILLSFGGGGGGKAGVVVVSG